MNLASQPPNWLIPGLLVSATHPRIQTFCTIAYGPQGALTILEDVSISIVWDCIFLTELMFNVQVFEVFSTGAAGQQDQRSQPNTYPFTSEKPAPYYENQ